MSILYFGSIVASFPLSLMGIVKHQCDLYTNYEYHLYFLVPVFLVVLSSDVWSLLRGNQIKKKVKEQSNLEDLEKEYNKKPFSCVSFLCEMFVHFLNYLASASFIYELYSDLLIVWIGLFSSEYVVFGFFAVIFPLINRIS